MIFIGGRRTVPPPGLAPPSGRAAQVRARRGGDELGDRRRGQLGLDRVRRAAVDRTRSGLHPPPDNAVGVGAVQPEDGVLAVDHAPDVGQRRGARVGQQRPAAADAGPRGDEARLAQAAEDAPDVHGAGAGAAGHLLRAQLRGRAAGQQGEHVDGGGELGVGRAGHDGPAVYLPFATASATVCHRRSATASATNTGAPRTMSLVITGAAGLLGRRTAELLLDAADPTDVVLVTRRPQELADLAARGAAVRFGDFTHPASLDAAFAGGERLLLISTDAVGARVAHHRAAIDSAARAGVRHIAYTSVLNPAPGTSPVADDHRATEQALRDSGLAWTALRNGLYAEPRIGEAQAALAAGALPHNLGDGRTAFVSREDCAAVAVAVLTGGAEHDGKAYDVTGPELPGGAELAALYAEVGGAPVAAIAVDDAAWIAGGVAAGLPEPGAALLAGFGRGIPEGPLAAGGAAGR